MARDPVNRHRGLGDGDLPRRWLRRHDDVEPDDDSHADELYIDDYWDPRDEPSSLDFELNRIWQDLMGGGYLPSLGSLLPRTEDRRPVPPAAVSTLAADQLADALYDRLQLVTSRLTLPHLERTLDGPAEQIRVAGQRSPELASWFHAHRGPGLVLVVLAPFWIRPLDACPSPVTGRSLIDHLLVRYPVPVPLYRPWQAFQLPSLKWVSWLLLIGQGASLHRAAPRFGWRISSKLLRHVLAAPPDLEPVESVMWAEIMRLGGSQREYDRIAAHPAYVLDPTASPGAPDSLTLEDEEPRHHGGLPAEPRQRFWEATVEWLVRHRDELTDDASAMVLDWAMHRYTEDLARGVAERERFSWHGRALAPTLNHATEYRRRIRTPFPVYTAPPAPWTRRGWDWEERRDDSVWSVRELTSHADLADESSAMHHCVVTYGYRCAQGRSAIFSVSRDGARRVTVEIEPRSRTIVQARGARNRACDVEEHSLLRRWLAALPKVS